MKILELGSKLNIDETGDEIEKTRIQLDTLVSLEDSSSTVMKEFKQQVEQINKILFELHADDNVSQESLLQKSTSLKQIGNFLIDAANKYQESFSETFLQQVKYLGLWFEGTGKEYAIYAFTKRVSKPSKQEIIQLLELTTDFVENHWETHPIKILERENYALQIAEAEKYDLSGEFMFGKLQEAVEKFIRSALTAADKVRLKELQNSSKSVKQILEWMVNTPKWQGDDLENCLEIVKNSRVQAEF